MTLIGGGGRCPGLGVGERAGIAGGAECEGTGEAGGREGNGGGGRTSCEDNVGDEACREREGNGGGCTCRVLPGLAGTGGGTRSAQGGVSEEQVLLELVSDDERLQSSAASLL